MFVAAAPPVRHKQPPRRKRRGGTAQSQKKCQATDFDRAERFRHPLHLALVDVDNFKQLNDTKGHSAGDAALTVIADTIRHNIRTSDIAARLGGDEFVIIFVEEPEADTYHSAQRLKEALDDMARRHAWPLGFSIGVVTSNGNGRLDQQEMIHRADQLMYEAKRTGKGRIVMAPLRTPLSA